MNERTGSGVPDAINSVITARGTTTEWNSAGSTCSAWICTR